MAKIVIPSDADPLKRGKDCEDFVPLEDGTKPGEPKYCDRSLDCRQFGMKTDYIEITDIKTGAIINHDYFCTGCYHIKGEMDPDEKAS